jgi:hypothetical protein
MVRALLLFFLFTQPVLSTTIAIIDTGFDLDHDFLRPRILKQETDEETMNPNLKAFSDWQFHDNSHLKEAVIKDQSLLQEVLLYRNLKAKGHTEGLSLQEFEWFKRKKADKAFLEKVRDFKKHTHGTFVAGVALREGENINIFPIRGLNIPVPVLAIEDSSISPVTKSTLKDPEARFKAEIKASIDRVSKKFTKICHYLSLNRVNVVNASYGITYKNILTKFREKYREITGQEISEVKLKTHVDEYFEVLYKKGAKTISRYPKILFVFSAGNSGINNDLYHHYPSRIRLPNTVSVGATNGDYLATFSNYGMGHVDVGAPGVAILSLVPRVYSGEGREMYSPSSGTSMAAPYISNLAAQILNTNGKLSPSEVKQIILSTGDEKTSLKERFVSGAVANNQRALKAALLSRDMKIDVAINLAKSDLIPLEDTISFGQPPAMIAEDYKQKVMGTIPSSTTIEEDDEPDFTTEGSSKPLDPAKGRPDNSVPLPSGPADLKEKSSDPALSNQSAEQSQLPAGDLPPSSSPDAPQPLQNQPAEPSPSSP